VDTQKRVGKRIGKREAALAILCSLLILGGCDDNAAEPEESSGAVLQGTVTSFDTGAGADPSPGLAALQVPDVLVSIGTLQTETDSTGGFTLSDIPVGDQNVSFAKSGAVGNYLLSGIAMGSSFLLEGVQVAGGAVSTSHTGTWEGTGGSTDPGSQGQVAMTMILSVNGNALTGTASIGPPDNTSWSISGTENGTSVAGQMTVESTESPCASGGNFNGAFEADTLSGTFVEVNPPAGCGDPEHGTFRVVKQ
jgi:hypothetical protein